jgi:hypothetical protein
MGWDEVKYRWTGADAGIAAAAKKAKDDGVDPLPKYLVTPYGLSPFQFHTDGVEGGQVVIKTRVYLASDADAKKPLEPWDIAAGAEVMLPLELARFGQKWMRDRFYKKGQAWLPLPDGATGSTLAELCQSLYAMRDKEPQLDVYHFFSRKKPGADGAGEVDKTAAEWDAEGQVRARILAKLVGHWQNTDYHFEQVRQGLGLSGDLAVPLRSAAGADVKLVVVLGEPPPPAAPAAVAPQGASGDAPGTGAAVKTGEVSGGNPPRPPLHQLPEALRLKLVESYDARKNGEPLSERNLDQGYGKGSSVWDAIYEGMSWQDINTMVRVYQRIEAVDKTGRLWRDHVLYFVRASTGTIYLLDVVYRDRTADRAELTAYLDEITHRSEEPRIGRERPIWQVLHSGTNGWREVSKTDQLHISVGDGTKPNPSEDIHIDETSFTHDRDPDGHAVAATLPTTGLKHLSQSLCGTIDIDRPFARLDELISTPAFARGSLRPETFADLERWLEVRGSKAVSGEDGHREALALWRRAATDVHDAAMGAIF